MYVVGFVFSLGWGGGGGGGGGVVKKTKASFEHSCHIKTQHLYHVKKKTKLRALFRTDLEIQETREIR